MYIYSCVYGAGSKGRQKQEINAEEGKNHRVKEKNRRRGKRKRGQVTGAHLLQQRRWRVQHRGQLPSLSGSKLRAGSQPGSHRGRNAAFSARPASGRKRGRPEMGGRGFPVLSPRRPNSALMPCYGITAADFNLVS